MFIYKITNKVNGKIYIGQVYNKSVECRFRRHIKDASKLNTHLSKAILKYGHSNFICEQIDTANNLTELNNKEKYYIKLFNSTDPNIGYNMTIGGDGGNTYQFKTKEEMEVIKQKLSKSNKGIKNGMAKPLYALNVKTGEVKYFECNGDCERYFDIKNGGIFVKHCLKEVKFYYKDEWTFSYDKNFMKLKFSSDRKTSGTPIRITNLKTNKSRMFPSLNKGELFTGLRFKRIFNEDKITIGNFLIEKISKEVYRLSVMSVAE